MPADRTPPVSNDEKPASATPSDRSAAEPAATGPTTSTIWKISLAALLGVIAAVIIVSAARSWTVTPPGIGQVTACIVLVAGGACWFWAWCALEGRMAGKTFRQADRSIDQKTHDSLAAQIERLERRARRMRRYLPLAITSALIGFLALLL